MFWSHFRERFMPRRKVASTATVSRVPEDAQVIAVAADVHVSAEETQEPVIPKGGQVHHWHKLQFQLDKVQS